MRKHEGGMVVGESAPGAVETAGINLEPENTDSTICLERMMLGHLGDLRPDAYRRKAFEEMAASVRPPSWGRFFARQRD
jgi:hypothetical protein